MHQNRFVVGIRPDTMEELIALPRPSSWLQGVGPPRKERRGGRRIKAGRERGKEGGREEMREGGRVKWSDGGRENEHPNF